ncbi:MAG: class I SAM-dependent methyltransferase [Acidobacteria bacterium]|nr:class I SAM-dependent methyltransferase [Acidobacteriota bacterium]MCZ6752195.1 class I SAM-dependent methyltransferase [Acidobacteriota bacterium]
MSQQERAKWDERFRTGDHADKQPDPFLEQLEEYSDLFPEKRRALDVACGAGRNAVYLAEKGWNVTACDISQEGLRRAKALATERGVRLELFCQDLFCQDLETASLGTSCFDLIICFFYLERNLIPVLKAALKPQGLIVYKTYSVEQLRFPGRPRHPMHLLERQELLELFRGFRILAYQETVQERGVAQLIAQKP